MTADQNIKRDEPVGAKGGVAPRSGASWAINAGVTAPPVAAALLVADGAAGGAAALDVAGAAEVVLGAAGADPPRVGALAVPASIALLRTYGEKCQRLIGWIEGKGAQ